MDFSSIAPIISSEMTKNSQNIQKNDKNSVEKTGKDFEALFYQTILSTMTKSMSAMNKSQGNKMQEQWAWSLMTQTISQELAQENHLNIGEILGSAAEKK